MIMDKIQIEEEKIRNQTRKKKVQQFTTIAILILTLSSIIYTLSNRPLTYFLQYSLYVALSATIPALLFIIFFWIKNGTAKPLKKDIKMILLFFLIVIPFIGLSYYSFGVLIKDTYLWIRSPSISKTGAVIVVIVGTLFIALILFYFRLKYRSLYGMSEAFVGLAVACNRVLSEYEQETFSPTFYFAILTAAIYLVVRGFDNIHQGINKEPIDPIVSKFIEKYFTKNNL